MAKNRDNVYEPKVFKGIFSSIRFLSPGIRVLAATLFGYGVTYFHEYGFLHTFSIDVRFITVSISSIVSNVIITLIFLLLVEIGTSILNAYLTSFKAPTATNRLRGDNALLIFIGVVILFISSTLGNVNALKVGLFEIIIYIVLALLMLLLLTFDLIKERNLEKALQNYYKRQDAERQRFMPQTSMQAWVLSFQALKIGLPILVVLAVSFFGGILDGISPNNYAVISQEGNKKLLLLRDYGGTLIEKYYDTKTNTFDKGYIIDSSPGKLSINSTVDTSRRSLGKN